MTNTKKQAANLAKLGRNGDDTLVHMSKHEVAGLHGIAQLAGRKLTTNPDTGMPEAFTLFDILPFALNVIFPGMGTLAQVGIGALSGAASASAQGQDPLSGGLTGGLMGGLGGALFGGGADKALESVAGAGAGAGANATELLGKEAAQNASQEALKQAAGQGLVNGAGSIIPTAASAAAIPTAASAAAPAAQAAGSGLDRWIADPLSKGNLPYTIGGGAALASMLDTGSNVDGTLPDNKAHMRNPSAPKTYHPLTGPNLDTYGQTGSQYQGEHTYFDPGPYTGSAYTGDPYQYPYKDGGIVAPGHKGMLHKDLGIPMGEKIPAAALARALHSSDPAIRKRAQFDKNFNHYADGGLIPAFGGGGAIAAALQQRTSNGQSFSQTDPGWLQSFQQNMGMTPGVTASNINAAGGSGKGTQGGASPKGTLAGKMLSVMLPGKQGFVDRDHRQAPTPTPTPPQQQPVQQQPIQSIQPTFNPTLFNAPTSFGPAPGAPPMQQGFADGGIAGMGGQVDPRIVQQLRSRGQPARMVNGSDPGMADSIPAHIDGKHPAKLSSGEVVIPADVVSMLGDGNTKAGAQMLRQMVERVRHQKTGSTQQAPAIDAQGAMPA